MQQGLRLGRNNEFLERYNKETVELSLLAKGDGTEIMTQKIKAGESIFMTPGDAEQLMEFAYVLDGKISYEKDGKDVILKNGDYFYVHKLKETVQFEVINDVTLLYVSTEPVFHYLSKKIKELHEIAKKSQAKDMYTHNHGDRVKNYAVKIANKLQLTKETVENIAFASLFHDIGKIDVPDQILQKPGRLSNKEMDYIKKHPSAGAQMVQSTYYKDIGKIIEQHHERLDGSGYPHGLMGYEICIEAKIIAIADSYDAMITDRPYKKAMSQTEALAELKILSGIHYDEKAVNVFEEILKEEGIIKE